MVTINTVPEGNYQYSIDGGITWPALNVFNDLPLGDYVVWVQSSCGTFIANFSIVTPNAPFGESPQFFSPGDTLADLQMNGQNIQWYDAAGRMLVDTPLPMSTLLVNNTTYYATQTINGAESSQRFPVLALDSTLAVLEHAFDGLMCYPNPANNLLSISNNVAIDAYVVYSVLGQKISVGNPHTAQTCIDVSALSNGTYFLKLQAAGAQKTIRFIKE